MNFDASISEAFEDSERGFQHSRQTIFEHVLQPLQSNKLFQEEAQNESEISTVKPLQDLIVLWERLRDVVALNVYDSHLYAEHKCEISSTTMVERSEDWIAIYLEMAPCLCDLVAGNCLQSSSKFVNLPPDFLKCLTGEHCEANGLSKKSTPELLQYLLLLPLERIQEYVNFLDKIHSRSDIDETDHLTEVLSAWRLLQEHSSRELDSARLTRSFWDSAPRKLVDVHCLSNRRLILDSRSSPITLISGSITPRGLLTPYFVLFNDIFLYYQYGTSSAFALETVWVEPVPLENENILENVFQLTMPEDNLTFLTDSAEGKTRWIAAFNQAICTVLENGKLLIHDSPRKWSLSHLRNNSSKNLANSRRCPPLARRAKHLFKNHPLFTGAVYTGAWSVGKMQGKGELIWPNQRKFLGSFRDSLQNGDGELTIKSEEGETVYTGAWVNGLMCGQGMVKYPNGDTFEGFFDADTRHGFGILKRGKLYNTAASIYVGEWKRNKKHGYGVYDEKQLGEVYYGMWKEDTKHGHGAVVTIEHNLLRGLFLQ